MRRTLLAAVVVGALVLLGTVKDAQAFGFRLGGLSVIHPDGWGIPGDRSPESKFAFGFDNDTDIVDFFAFNTGSLFAIDGDSMFIDGYLGAKFKFRVIPMLSVVIRGDFLMKYFYPFEDFLAGSFSIGGIVGPGVMVHLGDAVAVTIDFDVQFYKPMYLNISKGAGLEKDFQVAIAYLVGIAF